MAERRKEILEVIRSHLKDWKPTEWDEALLCDERFLSIQDYRFADPDLQISKIDELMNALKAALESYGQLNPAVRREMESAFLTNMENSRASTQVVPFQDGEPTRVYQPLGLLLRTVVGNMQGRDPDTLLNDARWKRYGKRADREAANAVRLLKKPSGKEEENETWQKATLVAQARRLWSKHCGKEPPKKPSEGAEFFNFVSDLIEAVGKDWSTESTFKAWNRRREDMDRYGLES